METFRLFSMVVGEALKTQIFSNDRFIVFKEKYEKLWAAEQFVLGAEK